MPVSPTLTQKKMIEQNLHRLLLAFAKAPKRSEATLYIEDNYYYAYIENENVSSLKVKLGYTRLRNSELVHRIPKIKVAKGSHCELSIDETGYKITTKDKGITTTTRLETCPIPKARSVNITEPEMVFTSSDFFSKATGVAIAASDDHTKQILRCVSVSYDTKGGHSLAATDGHRLAYTSRLPEDGDYKFLILAEDLKMLSLLASEDVLTVKGNIITVGTDIDYCCHLEDACPDYARLLQRLGNYRINLGSIKDLIKQLRTLGKKDTVSMTVTDYTLEFTSGDKVFNHIASNSGLHLYPTIKLNRDYLIDGLRGCSGHFYYEDSKSPLIFIGLEVNYVAMPILGKR